MLSGLAMSFRVYAPVANLLGKAFYLILKEGLTASSNLMRQKRAPSQKKTDRPLQDIEKEESSVYLGKGRRS